MSSAIYEGIISHIRNIPVKNSFVYPMFMFSIDLSSIEDLEKLRFLSVNGKGIYSFRDSDHLKFLDVHPDISQKSLFDRLKEFLEKNHSVKNISKIILLTNLRIFGYVFNPVSFYYIFQKRNNKDTLQSILCEVNNTYGEQKPYFIKNYKSPPVLKKFFYISPFISPQGEFHFQFKNLEDSLFVEILAKENNQTMLRAVLKGNRKELNDQKLFFYLWKLPFYTLQVILLIHWQALKLYLKKVPFFSKEDSDKLIQKNI